MKQAQHIMDKNLVKKPTFLSMAIISTPVLLSVALSGCVTQNYENDKTPVVQNQANRDDMAATRVSLGLGYLKMGNMPQAKQNLEKAKGFAPDMVQVYTAFAHYYETVGEHTLTVESFEKALSIKSDDADTLNNYGVYLCRQKQFDAAEKQFLKAIAVPTYVLVAKSYDNLSSCFLQNDNFVKAETYLEKAIAHNPSSAATLLQMVQLQYAMGNYKQAKTFVQRFEKVTRRFTSQSLALAYKVHFKLGQRRTAKNYGAMLVKMYPQSWEAQQYLLNELALIEADNLAKRYLLTKVSAKNGKPKKRIVKLSPKHPAALRRDENNQETLKKTVIAKKAPVKVSVPETSLAPRASSASINAALTLVEVETPKASEVDNQLSTPDIALNTPTAASVVVNTDESESIEEADIAANIETSKENSNITSTEITDAAIDAVKQIDEAVNSEVVTTQASIAEAKSEAPIEPIVELANDKEAITSDQAAETIQDIKSKVGVVDDSTIDTALVDNTSVDNNSVENNSVENNSVENTSNDNALMDDTLSNSTVVDSIADEVALVETNSENAITSSAAEINDIESEEISSANTEIFLIAKKPTPIVEDVPQATDDVIVDEVAVEETLENTPQISDEVAVEETLENTPQISDEVAVEEPLENAPQISDEVAVEETLENTPQINDEVVVDETLENTKQNSDELMEEKVIVDDALEPKTQTPEITAEEQTKKFPKFHVVSSGETLYSISVKYNIKLKALRRWNNISKRKKIYIKEIIFLENPKLVNQ
ncbi:hypothetical protein NBRC116592_00550 [Colwellia sp. KU-HH00111]|uniref:type IV pilus biogenesis/stability protein PilW n=1 Tax=Colwellia sp. KU-HH00111 TaxID=3127652 RepID=UPI00310713D6